VKKENKVKELEKTLVNKNVSLATEKEIIGKWRLLRDENFLSSTSGRVLLK